MRQHVSRKEEKKGKSLAADVQCTLEGTLAITTQLINSLTYLLLSRHCVSVDNATSQSHCVSEQVVLGRLPWCWVILLLRDSRASTNTTGHFPLMWHKRKRLKMSVLTLAACWNQCAESSAIYNADTLKGNHVTPRPPPDFTSPPHSHATTLNSWLESEKNAHKLMNLNYFLMSTRLALGW